MRHLLTPRLRASLLLALVGGIGFFSGLLVERVVLAPAGPLEGETDRAVVRIIRGGEDARPTGARTVIRLGLPEELAEELDLSDSQRTEVERIMAEDQAALRELTDRLEPSMIAIVERSRQRVYEVLTDEQIERWEEWPALRLRRDGEVRRD